MAKRIAVVVSQGQSANPAKRGLEEDIVTALLMEPGVDVAVIPHLYDLKSDGTGLLALQGIQGDMIVLSWLFERAARWTLDRHAIRGLPGKTLVVPPHDSADEDDIDDLEEGLAEDNDHEPVDDEKTRVAGQRKIPDRRIYCLDLRIHSTADPYVNEVRRIATESRVQLVNLGGWLGGEASPGQAARYEHPENDTALPLAQGMSREAGGDSESLVVVSETARAPRNAMRILEEPDRRWYPVIDYSRCTNCMECIDFCLFGVYGVDRAETILVEQPDNCRKGCPACSRVCPENAIIFPQHKSPAIAGAAVGMVSLKIDLSKLFGAPDEGKSALEMAALERDEQLMLVGRQPVGMTVGVPKRQEGKATSAKDDLDDLLDELDNANL